MAFRGVGGLEFWPLLTLKCVAIPEDFAVARIFTRRSEMARGVGASKFFAVCTPKCCQIRDVRKRTGLA